MKLVLSFIAKQHEKSEGMADEIMTTNARRLFPKLPNHIAWYERELDVASRHGEQLTLL